MNFLLSVVVVVVFEGDEVLLTAAGSLETCEFTAGLVCYTICDYKVRG